MAAVGVRGSWSMVRAPVSGSSRRSVRVPVFIKARRSVRWSFKRTQSGAFVVICT